MSFKDVIDEEERTAYMLCNEAIVRAALEADVQMVSFYPGAPQTEILDSFERASSKYDYKIEVAANEKVALETVAGASMLGKRTLTSMKSVGTNVASDTLYTLAYTGLKGGCLCLIADDPHAHSSQSEQDGRWFGPTTYLPMLEPSTPKEAMEMVKKGFELSEEFGTLVLIRTTTRVNHQSGIVHLGPMNRTRFEKVSWKEMKRPYTSVGELARKGKQMMLERLDKIRNELNESPLNRVEYFDGKKLMENGGDEEKFGIVTAGVSHSYTVEALARLKLPAKILKVGVINPMPEEKIVDFCQDLDKVVVVEELSPFMEDVVRRLVTGIEIYGKRTGHFSEALEYDIPSVLKGLSSITGIEPSFDYKKHCEEMKNIAEILPQRLPVFCAGCPHRATFWALRRAVGDPDSVFFANDIGCYSMMCLPPVEWSDTLLCMGASIGVAAGVQYTAKEKTIAVLGDSTFFHAALPGIVNLVHNEDDVTLFVLDNAVTAMTGQQSHPGNHDKAGGREGKKLDIRSVLEGFGVEKIYDISSYDVKDNVPVIKEALEHEGVSAVISHGECALYHYRNYRHDGGKLVPYFIDLETCESVHACVLNFMCPAISVMPGKDGKARIHQDICVGCGVCSKLCPKGAIKSTATIYGGENKPIYTVEDYEKYEEKKEAEG